MSVGVFGVSVGVIVVVVFVSVGVVGAKESVVPKTRRRQENGETVFGSWVFNEKERKVEILYIFFSVGGGE